MGRSVGGFDSVAESILHRAIGGAYTAPVYYFHASNCNHNAMTDHAVFIHSTGTGPFMWKRLMAGLPDGLPAVTPVNRGYAPHDLMARGTPFEIPMDLAHVKQQLPTDATGLHLVAHSYGGLLAMQLALDPEVPVKSLWLYEPVMFGSMKALAAQAPERLSAPVMADLQGVFANTRLFDDLEVGGTDAWLEGFVDYWSAPGVWAAMPDKVKDMNRAVGWKMFMEVRSQALMERPVGDYRFDSPVTLLHGALSPSPAQEMVRQLARVNPQAQVEVLEGLAHMSLITQADAVLPAFRAHWARLGLADLPR